MINLTPMNCSRGAPMGRASASPANWQADPAPRSLRLVNVPLDTGGYDSGGAYWGLGDPLYCLATRAGEPLAFVRASRRLTAAMALGVEQAALVKPLPRDELHAAFRQWAEGRYPRSWDEHDPAGWFIANGCIIKP